MVYEKKRVYEVNGIYFQTIITCFERLQKIYRETNLWHKWPLQIDIDFAHMFFHSSPVQNSLTTIGMFFFVSCLRDDLCFFSLFLILLILVWLIASWPPLLWIAAVTWTLRIHTSAYYWKRTEKKKTTEKCLQKNAEKRGTTTPNDNRKTSYPRLKRIYKREAEREEKKQNEKQHTAHGPLLFIIR